MSTREGISGLAIATATASCRFWRRSSEHLLNILPRQTSLSNTTSNFHHDIFRLIAKGASGGHGRLSRKSSHGAVVTAIMKLTKGET